MKRVAEIIIIALTLFAFWSWEEYRCYRRVMVGRMLVGFIVTCLMVIVLLVGFHAAHAHDRWQDGSPVPDWVKQYCCGPADVHHYSYDDVRITPDGFVLPDYPKVIAADDKTHVFKSEDGDYWAFFATYSDGSKSDIYCFFAPPGSI